MNKKAIQRRIKRHIIAGKNKLFIAVQPGLEEAAELELSKLGIPSNRETEPGSLTAEANLEEIWKCGLFCRSISRLYLRLGSFKADGFKDFKEKVARIPWELYLEEGCSFKTRTTSSHCRLYVDDKISKALRHGIGKRFTSLKGSPPWSIDPEDSSKNPAIQNIILRGKDDHFTISLDAGGGALYKRAYRKHINEAPLKENIAAALLILARLPDSTLLLDSMCGSGTFGLEALALSAGLPLAPGKKRPWEFWPSFRQERYNWLLGEAGKEQKIPWEIHSRDMDSRSLEIAADNRCFFDEAYGKGDSLAPGFPSAVRHIKLEKADFFLGVPDMASQLLSKASPFLILNPPYGRRLNLENRLHYFQRLGHCLKKYYSGVRWGIIVPGLECEKALGLHWDKKYIFKNGGFPVSYILGGPELPPINH